MSDQDRRSRTIVNAIGDAAAVPADFAGVQTLPMTYCRSKSLKLPVQSCLSGSAVDSKMAGTIRFGDSRFRRFLEFGWIRDSECDWFVPV